MRVIIIRMPLLTMNLIMCRITPDCWFHLMQVAGSKIVILLCDNVTGPPIRDRFRGISLSPACARVCVHARSFTYVFALRVCVSVRLQRGYLCHSSVRLCASVRLVVLSYN